MELRMPTIEFPWTRRTPLQKAQAELRKVQRGIQKQASRIELPKVTRKDVDAAVEETRKAVSTGVEGVADQLAVGAAALGHEAGELGKDAGKRGRELGHDLRGLTDDVRSIHITRQPRRSDILPGIALLAGLGSGLAAMFFFDPEQGRRRRALLRDQLVKWTRVTRETVTGRVEDLRNRSVGLAHEMRKGAEQVRGSEDESTGLGQLADTSPDASRDLSATDLAAKHGQPVAQSVGGSSWGEDLSLPEAREGQPDLDRGN